MSHRYILDDQILLDTNTMSISISAINIYPVKSLAGVTLSSAHLDYAGIDHDRSWMVVKPDGQFLTQRTQPQMALVHAQVENSQLVLSSFGMDSHSVELADKSMPRLKTEVWGDRVDAIDTGDASAEWLSQALAEECRLVFFPTDEIRSCDPQRTNEGDHTRFADGFPLLLVSEESLGDLNNRLEIPVGMDRFRPNIVIRGCPAFSEDTWKTIEVNGLPLRIVDRCPRCSVPTVDPTTGVLSGPEPIHTLSSYREQDGEIFFGVNAVPDSSGTISVGDAIKLID
ncbi:MAG: MOSC domain-containing protein [bacterium]